MVAPGLAEAIGFDLRSDLSGMATAERRTGSATFFPGDLDAVVAPRPFEAMGLFLVNACFDAKSAWYDEAMGRVPLPRVTSSAYDLCASMPG